MERRSFIVCGVGYGDEGKGSLVDLLTRAYGASLVVRYNGGSQAAHHVIEASGRHHTFSQFGSGTLAGAMTYLSEHMLVNPLNLIGEATGLKEIGVPDPLNRIGIDLRARVITPYQKSVGRLREMLRGDRRHGSCGEGVGELRWDEDQLGSDFVLRMEDLVSPKTCKSKLELIRELKNEDAAGLVTGIPSASMAKEIARLAEPVDQLCEVYADFVRAVTLGDQNYLQGLLGSTTAPVIFEGAQGVLLDETYGFHPYTTWSDTTMAGALDLLNSCPGGYQGDIVKIGVLRAYTTRHGAGPFVTESDIGPKPELHNSDNRWQKTFRVGPFDHVIHRYAAEIAGPFDCLAVGHLDQLGERWRSCLSYRVPANCEHFFEVQDSYSNQIRLRQDPDFDHQVQLGTALGVCEPRYQSWTSVPDYLDAISQTMGAPVGISSFGATAEAKVIHESWKARVS